MEQAVAVKKRETKPGVKRITVTLVEAEYNQLVVEAGKQMREPNNLLSFLLRGKMGHLISPPQD